MLIYQNPIDSLKVQNHTHVFTQKKYTLGSGLTSLLILDLLSCLTLTVNSSSARPMGSFDLSQCQIQRHVHRDYSKASQAFRYHQMVLRDIPVTLRTLLDLFISLELASGFLNRLAKEIKASGQAETRL